MAKGTKLPQTTRKKSTPKKARKKPQARKKSARRKKAEPRKAEQIEVQIEVWTAYERTRSIRHTAAETGHAEHVVREILRSDRERCHGILDEFLEACVAEWEQKAMRAHLVLDRLFGIFDELVAEIAKAAEDGRPTRITGPDGQPLSPIAAAELLVASRLFGQITQAAQVAHNISAQYRARRGEAGAGQGDTGDAVLDENPETWSDIRLAQAIRAGGLRVPKVLERKVKLLEAKAD